MAETTSRNLMGDLLDCYGEKHGDQMRRKPDRIDELPTIPMSGKSVLMLKPDSVVIDKYSGAEFTVAEVLQLVSAMIRTDSIDSIHRFCERFESIDCRCGGGERRDEVPCIDDFPLGCLS